MDDFKHQGTQAPAFHRDFLLANSSISRDRTGGKKAEEDENLRVLSYNTEEFAEMRNRVQIESSDESNEPPDKSNEPPPISNEPPDIVFSGSSSDDLEQSQTIQNPMQTTEPIPWHASTLGRPVNKGKKRKVKNSDQTSAGKRSIGIAAPRDSNGADHQETVKGEGGEKAPAKDPSLPKDSDSRASEPQKNAEDRNDLANTLANRAFDYLGLDLYGDSNLAKFFGFFLETINKQAAHMTILQTSMNELQDELETLRDSTAAQNERSVPPSAQNTAPLSSDQDSIEIERHGVFHRVKCDRKGHRHASGVFFDRPSRRGLELNGDTFLWDFTTYLFENPDIVFVVYQNYDCNGTPGARPKHEWFKKTRPEHDDVRQVLPDNESIYVVSSTLRSALNEVGKCSPFDDESNGEMKAPFLFIYHHRPQLRALAEKKQGDLSLHVSSILSYVESNYKEEYDDADAIFAKCVVTPEHLTKLWIPNQLIIMQKEGHHVVRVLRHWPEPRWSARAVQKPLNLISWSWDYDGNNLRRSSYVDDIGLAGHDEIRIDQLSIYPLKFASKELQDRLRVRGQNYWSLRRQHFVAYSGLDFNGETAYDRTRFMIDMKTYHKIHSDHDDRYRHDKDQFDPWHEEISCEREHLDAAELMLLPPNIHGFDFQEKQWVSLSIDLIEDVIWNKNAFDRLVLPSSTKELIQALVTARISGMQDIVANKGNGLVILLHGGPGTGKTLTAETVAETSEKPLYRVTCGDIGTTAARVEKYLTSIFYLGKIWGCVVLLDEADIFLEERSFADLERNSFVSVFLRSLEYYDGILILTSNRVGTFDAAFKSRIQLSLHYSNLSRSSRKKIWQNFIDILEGLDVDVDIAELERHLDHLAEDEMNGRQIRNCVTIARGLATFRREKLGWTHLEQALRTVSDFQKYLRNVHSGLTEDEMAREDNLR